MTVSFVYGELDMVIFFSYTSDMITHHHHQLFKLMNVLSYKYDKVLS